MLPDAFLARMRRLLGDEFDAFLASYELPRNVGIRLNPRKVSSPLSFCGDRVGAERVLLRPVSAPGAAPVS